MGFVCLCSVRLSYFALINGKTSYLLLKIPENMVEKAELPTLSRQASSCCCSFTHCRQFEFSLAACVRLAAVFQRRNLAEESAKKILCSVNKCCTLFFFFVSAFSVNFEVGCYAVKIPVDQQSAPTATFNIAEIPDFPILIFFSSQLFSSGSDPSQSSASV